MTDRELIAFMQGWFERFIIRFDRLDKHLEKMAMKEKLLEGERLLDNQDVCQLLHISKLHYSVIAHRANCLIK
ncbi:MAG: hypothetical protein EZS26_004008 [Candidatus Ordinivivax streblomastigis]|uniref:Uncharacterized protein n=1 Tax=Candidatus Ordinivivax streblomastigis TaxID=2540710 RepID=A0A5M8NSK0_9BACT|nr:MAG: hypothetical protein EZS26_004008 [Candidatus Ordinivivax streblomastigis]